MVYTMHLFLYSFIKIYSIIDMKEGQEYEETIKNKKVNHRNLFSIIAYNHTFIMPPCL